MYQAISSHQGSNLLSLWDFSIISIQVLLSRRVSDLNYTDSRQPVFYATEYATGEKHFGSDVRIDQFS